MFVFGFFVAMGFSECGPSLTEQNYDGIMLKHDDMAQVQMPPTGFPMATDPFVGDQGEKSESREDQKTVVTKRKKFRGYKKSKNVCCLWKNKKRKDGLVE